MHPKQILALLETFSNPLEHYPEAEHTMGFGLQMLLRELVQQVLAAVHPERCGGGGACSAGAEDDTAGEGAKDGATGEGAEGDPLPGCRVEHLQALLDRKYSSAQVGNLTHRPNSTCIPDEDRVWQRKEFRDYIQYTAGNIRDLLVTRWRPGVVGIYLDIMVEVLSSEMVNDPLDVASFIRHCICVDCVES